MLTRNYEVGELSREVGSYTGGEIGNVRASDVANEHEPRTTHIEYGNAQDCSAGSSRYPGLETYFDGDQRVPRVVEPSVCAELGICESRLRSR